MKRLKTHEMRIDFRKKVPHRIPHGEKFPIKKKTMFSISRSLTQKMWMVQVLRPIIKHLIFSLPHVKRLKTHEMRYDFREKVPHRIPHGEKFPIRKVQKKDHVLNIAGLNTKMWMVQVLDTIKAFL